MSYTKNFQKYPEEFGQLLERAALERIAVPFATAKDAKRFMGRFYAYIGSLEAAWAESPDGDPLLTQLRNFGLRVQLRIEGTSVVLRPIDQDDDAQLLRSILAKEQPAGETVLVPINLGNLPPGLRELAIQRKV